MIFATPPPPPPGRESGARGRPVAVTADRAIHGIMVGCVACAPFWLVALLVLTLGRY